MRAEVGPPSSPIFGNHFRRSNRAQSGETITRSKPRRLAYFFAAVQQASASVKASWSFGKAPRTELVTSLGCTHSNSRMRSAPQRWRIPSKRLSGAKRPTRSKGLARQGSSR